MYLTYVSVLANVIVSTSSNLSMYVLRAHLRGGHVRTLLARACVREPMCLRTCACTSLKCVCVYACGLDVWRCVLWVCICANGMCVD